MKNRLIALASVASLALAACAHENAYESEADKITKAVQANTFANVSSDIDPSVLKRISRVKVAEDSAILAPLGPIKSVKEVPCTDGYSGHCLTIEFEKGTADERIALNDQKKVVEWRYAHVVAK